MTRGSAELGPLEGVFENMVQELAELYRVGKECPSFNGVWEPSWKERNDLQDQELRKGIYDLHFYGD